MAFGEASRPERRPLLPEPGSSSWAGVSSRQPQFRRPETRSSQRSSAQSSSSGAGILAAARSGPNPSKLLAPSRQSNDLGHLRQSNATGDWSCRAGTQGPRGIGRWGKGVRLPAVPSLRNTQQTHPRHVSETFLGARFSPQSPGKALGGGGLLLDLKHAWTVMLERGVGAEQPMPRTGAVWALLGPVPSLVQRRRGEPCQLHRWLCYPGSGTPGTARDPTNSLHQGQSAWAQAEALEGCRLRGDS